MSLAPGEQRALTEIESQLRHSDPELAAMFARFPGQVARGRHAARKLLPPWPSLPGEASRIIVAAVCLALLIACAVAGGIATSHTGPSRGVFGPGSGITPAGGRLSAAALTGLRPPLADWVAGC